MSMDADARPRWFSAVVRLDFGEIELLPAALDQVRVRFGEVEIPTIPIGRYGPAELAAPVARVC